MTWKETWQSYPARKRRGLKGVAAFWLFLLLWACFPLPITHMIVGLVILALILYIIWMLSYLVYEFVSGNF